MKRTHVVVLLMYVVGQCLPSSVSDDNGTCEISNRCQAILKNRVNGQIGGESWTMPKKSAELNTSVNQSVATAASQSLFVLDNRIPVATNRSGYEHGKWETISYSYYFINHLIDLSL